MAEDLRLITAFGGETIHADKLIELCADQGITIDNIHVAPSHAKDSVAFITGAGLSAGELTTLDTVVIANYTAEPYITINGNSSFFDPVLSWTTTAPPADPDLGDSFVVPAGATGVWSGLAENLVRWSGNAWLPDKLHKGVRVEVLNDGVDIEYDGTTWAIHDYGGGAPTPTLVSYTRTTEVAGVDSTPRLVNFDRSNCDAIAGLFTYSGGTFTAVKKVKCRLEASATAAYVSGTNPRVHLEIVKNAATVLNKSCPSFETSGAKDVQLAANSATTLNPNDSFKVRVYTSAGVAKLLPLTAAITVTAYEI